LIQMPRKVTNADAPKKASLNPSEGELPPLTFRNNRNRPSEGGELS
jgi:hypothetical protein